MEIVRNIGKQLIYGLTVLGLLIGSVARAQSLNGMAGRAGIAPKAMVAACNAESALAGEQILRQGGSAVDAFIAATFVDYVVSPGFSSAAGPLALLTYDATSKRIEYLHAGLKRAGAVDGQSSPNTPSRGRAFLIPGAIAGLEAAHYKYGRLSWHTVLTPATKLAREGFLITPLYESAIKTREGILSHNDYGARTFFRNGHTLDVGDVLRLPALADTLEGVARDGAKYFYQGPYAAALVKAVNAKGGKLTMEDLSSYRPVWIEPLKVQYRDYEVFVPSRYSFGGAQLALALRLMDNIDFSRAQHWTLSTDSLVKMVDIYRNVLATSWVYDRGQLADPKLVEKHLSPAEIRNLWRQMSEVWDALPAPRATGSHSYHVVVVDEKGNIASGTNTIESVTWTNDPIFVGGIPLNDTGKIAVPGPAGAFILESLNPWIMLKNDIPVTAGGVIGHSLFPADMEVISNLVDFKMNAEDRAYAAIRCISDE